MYSTIRRKGDFNNYSIIRILVVLLRRKVPTSKKYFGHLGRIQ